jgi:hypothetical protein
VKGDGGSRYDCTAEMSVGEAFLAYQKAGWPVGIDRGHINLGPVVPPPLPRSGRVGRAVVCRGASAVLGRLPRCIASTAPCRWCDPG